MEDNLISEVTKATNTHVANQLAGKRRINKSIWYRQKDVTFLEMKDFFGVILKTGLKVFERLVCQIVV